jgi:hypothetical protein
MSLIRATYYPPKYDSNGYPNEEQVETRLCSDVWQAEQWARRKLGKLYTTNDCYHRDLGRAASMRLERVIRHDRSVYHKFVGYLEPKVIIVPSVGELGYW